MTFDIYLIFDSIPKMLAGIGVTLQLLFLSSFLGLVLGIIILLFEAIRDSVFWPILREPFGCAILALTLNSGAYVSEILRGGYLGVDKGLHEAGKALGLSTPHRFIYVTTPIAVRLAIPAYSNDFISMLKATSLASTITLLDMTGAARTIVAKTFAPYEIFIAAAIIYLVMTWFIQRGFGLFERRMSRYIKQWGVI